MSTSKLVNTNRIKIANSFLYTGKSLRIISFYQIHQLDFYKIQLMAQLLESNFQILSDILLLFNSFFLQGEFLLQD